jgi:menaquinone-dependent protoporphyrinogen IX oxidase
MEATGRNVMTVPVTAASRHGSTAEIAEAIGRTLRQRGLDVEVQPAAGMSAVDRYEAVVLGSAVDPHRLGFAERAMIRAVRAQTGDFRNWTEIAAWAEEIADALQS